jgi:hypothetical protein
MPDDGSATLFLAKERVEDEPFSFDERRNITPKEQSKRGTSDKEEIN